MRDSFNSYSISVPPVLSPTNRCEIIIVLASPTASGANTTIPPGACMVGLDAFAIQCATVSPLSTVFALGTVFSTNRHGLLIPILLPVKSTAL